MSRREKNYAGIAAALAVERMVATITLCVVGVVCWLIAWPANAWLALVLMLAALAALLVLYAAVVHEHAAAAGLVAPEAEPVVAQEGGLAAPGGAPVAGHAGGLVAKVFGLGILTHGLGVVAYSLVAMSLGLDLSLATIAWTRSAAVLIAILPISIAGLGVRESAMVVLLAAYGIDAADALTDSLLAFATTVLAMGLLGGMLEGVRLLR